MVTVPNWFAMNSKKGPNLLVLITFSALNSCFGIFGIILSLRGFGGKLAGEW